MEPIIETGHSTAILFGLTAGDFAGALLVAAVSWLAMRFALRLALSAIDRLAAGGNRPVVTALAEIVGSTNGLLVVLTALLIGVSTLALPERWGARVSHLWFLTLMLQFALWANRAVTLALRRYFQRHSDSADARTIAQASASATLSSWLLRTALWTVALLAILSNLGVNITALVASLGVGGIAIALAVQNVLGDVFASLAIAVDKPFEVGDPIAVGAVNGTVEYIGLKSTRIRSAGGEQIVMSNTDLLKQTISNFRRMTTRRVVIKLGVSYDTTPEQAEKIPALLRRLIEADERARFDRAHLKGFGDSSIDYEAVYRVMVADFGVHMDILQAIHLGLMRELAALGVTIAFPTRTVHLVTSNADAARPGASAGAAPGSTSGSPPGSAPVDSDAAAPRPGAI
ncbi:MAG: mechanosensitive ion channel family protein [Lautropia sp.]